MPMPRAYAWLKEGETCRYCIGSGAALGGRCKHCGGLGKTFGGKPREACADCDGQGKIVKTQEKCPTCEGKGWADLEAKPTVACRYCMGSGTTVGGTCKHCGGAGRMELDKEGNPIDVAVQQAKSTQKCPMCLGMGYRARGTTCDACGGSGVTKVAPPPKGASTTPGPAAAPAAVSTVVLPGPKAPVIKTPEISQGNPLAQSKFGASKFCMGCGSGIPPGASACPKCGKAANPATPSAVPATKAGGGAPAGAAPAPTLTEAQLKAQALFKPPQYCKACGTAFKAGVTHCPKCGKAAPPPAA